MGGDPGVAKARQEEEKAAAFRLHVGRTAKEAAKQQGEARGARVSRASLGACESAQRPEGLLSRVEAPARVLLCKEAWVVRGGVGFARRRGLCEETWVVRGDVDCARRRGLCKETVGCRAGRPWVVLGGRGLF